MGNTTSGFFNKTDKEMPVDISKAYIYKLHTKDDGDFTGWERVKKIFETDMYGEITPELERCADTITYTFIVGAIIGGVGRSRVAYMNFFSLGIVNSGQDHMYSHGTVFHEADSTNLTSKVSNMHTAFETPSRAKAKLQEAVLLGFGSGAYRIGWRVGLFSTIYSVSSTCATAYRGKPSFLDPAFGGAAAGFLYKFHEGPKLTLAGTVIGGLFGLVGGTLTNGAMVLIGVSPDEVLAQSRQSVYDRRQKELEQLQAQRSPQVTKVTLDEFHAAILNESETEEKSSQPNNPNQPNTPIVNVSNTQQCSLQSSDNTVVLPS